MLILKQDHFDVPVGFRPIALCNVIYKIMSTIIVNRLKTILPILISPDQTRFDKGRQILDSIITTNKAIHSLHALKSKGMMMKLDLDKSYDCLSWTSL